MKFLTQTMHSLGMSGGPGAPDHQPWASGLSSLGPVSSQTAEPASYGVWDSHHQTLAAAWLEPNLGL